MSPWVEAIAMAAAIGSGLVAGCFFAFSSFIMPALAELRAGEGARAMNAINVTVINPLCFVLFMGTAALCVVLVGWALAGGTASPGLLLGGSMLYLLGCFLVTGLKNVPLNDRLAEASGQNLVQVWAHYLTRWTAWNHVRTVAAAMACGLFILAIRS